MYTSCSTFLQYIDSLFSALGSRDCSERLASDEWQAVVTCECGLSESCLADRYMQAGHTDGRGCGVQVIAVDLTTALHNYSSLGRRWKTVRRKVATITETFNLICSAANYRRSKEMLR